MKPFVLASCLAAALAATVLGQGPMDTVDSNGSRAGHVPSPSAVGKARAIVGRPAPTFEAVDAEGRPVTLKSLRARPTILVFLGKNCPWSGVAKPYFDRIQNVYGDVANVVGVVVGPPEDAIAWKADASPQFRVVSDPSGKIASDYGVDAALACPVIDTQGHVALSYAGYSSAMLTEMMGRVARIAGVKDRRMATYPAPLELTCGCGFGAMHSGN